jgi:hypothetical protein
MSRGVCWLATLGVTAATVAATDDPPKVRDTLSAGFFPMAVGSKWVYAFEEKEVSFDVLRAENMAETKVFVVRRTIDKSAVEFRLAVEEDGVYVSREGDREFSPPLRQFAFFARTGDIWKWRGTFGAKKRVDEFKHRGLEEVKVPAGTYNAVAVLQTTDGGDDITFWLARGVGVVRLSGKTELDPKVGKVVFEWKLKSYRAGVK